MKVQLPFLIAASSVAPVLSQAGEVYLTFDDGPIDATFGVLDVLAEMNTKATFFLNGFHLFGEGDENEDRALEALKHTVDDGHIIANHSWNHMLHNCCNAEGECGAVVCNDIGMWNVGAYRSVQTDMELFHFNTQVMRQLLKSHNKGKIVKNDMLHSMARLPYTNSYRLDEIDSDCTCCTSDEVPPWDENFECSLENPTFSGTLSALVADKLKSDGMDVYGWDLEWGPENWGAGDVASTLTTAEDLAETVIGLSKANTCMDQSAKANIAYCDPQAHHGKVVILTHDFLFEDGARGQGATANLPKLRDFIKIMEDKGFFFKTLDQYASGDVQEVKKETSGDVQEVKKGKSGKVSKSGGGKSGKGRKMLFK